MDDDALRRGKPTVHVAFDEATAILAGDALQALAFEVLGRQRTAAADDARGAAVRELAVAAGVRGMCGGQALDLDATGRRCARRRALQRLHALQDRRADARLGAHGRDRARASDAANRDALDAFADALGLAFQIRDDLLDIEGDSATLGKTAGKDVAQAKATFPALLGHRRLARAPAHIVRCDARRAAAHSARTRRTCRTGATGDRPELNAPRRCAGFVVGFSARHGRAGGRMRRSGSTP